MLILWLFLFIEAIQSGAADSFNTLSTDQFNALSVPDPSEYVSFYKLSVQTAYVTSVECMLSSGYHIESGFKDIDSAAADNSILTLRSGVDGVQDMISYLRGGRDLEIESKLDAVIFMTVNYYVNGRNSAAPANAAADVPRLGDLTDINDARSVLVARRCQSSYSDFANQIESIKERYVLELSVMDYKHFDRERQWSAIVDEYNEANEAVLNDTDVYAGIRDAFAFGSGINICSRSSSSFDERLLEIYNCDDLSLFFGDSQSSADASSLFSKTVAHMYSIYKSALLVIYLNSVCHSNLHVALRTMIWEQVNLVRANFEFMSQCIVKFIQEVETNAESDFGKNSEEYHQAMNVLKASVNRMLLTAILSTSVQYRQALSFSADGSMIQNNYNKYNAEELSKYYDKIFWKNSNVRFFDLRFVNQQDSPIPSTGMSIPHNMYSLTVNKMVFQAFICEVNYLIVKMQKIQTDRTDLSTWIYNQITLKEMEYSVIFAKCSVMENKMYSINAATYVYVMLTQAASSQNTDESGATDVERTENTESGTDVDQTENTGLSDTNPISNNGVSENEDDTEVTAIIMNCVSTDIIGMLCVHSVDLSQAFHNVEIYINQNTNLTTSSINYEPGMTSNADSGVNGNYGFRSASTANAEVNRPSGVGDSNINNIGTYGTSSSGEINTEVITGNLILRDNNSNKDDSLGDSGAFSIAAISQITEGLQYFQTSVTSEFLSTMNFMRSLTETEYTKSVLASLKGSQEQFNINFEYINCVLLESVKYINNCTTPGTSEYFAAMTSLLKDTVEKEIILRSLIEAPLSRANDFGLDVTDYPYISQSIKYTSYVEKFYQYFGVDYKQLYYDGDNDVSLLLTNSISTFTRIHETVMAAMQQTEESAYSKFLLWNLEQTFAAFQTTCESIATQISQTQMFISESSESSQIAFYNEIKLRIETVWAIYSATFIKCHQFASSSTPVSINYQSDLEVVKSQISFGSVTEYQSSSETMVTTV